MIIVLFTNVLFIIVQGNCQTFTFVIHIKYFIKYSLWLVSSIKSLSQLKHILPSSFRFDARELFDTHSDFRRADCGARLMIAKGPRPIIGHVVCLLSETLTRGRGKWARPIQA